MKSIRLSVLLGLLAVPVAAQDLSGAEIAGTIAGKTVQGGMVETGAYTEFYDADGTIRGAGYTGRWSVQGDTMCFEYDGAAAGCFGIRMEGEVLNWIVDGEVTGTGTIVEGNPNGF